MTELLLGNEAVALAALHAGIRGAFSYPGTPATEIFEFIQSRTRLDGSVAAAWSANEKVAYEEALGMSFAGRRGIVSMKHVGLNVAADPFMSSALTGARGGLVLAVADDPGMHSSQNEQDSRCLGDFAQIPIFEPSNQQEAYDMTRAAFDLSEQWETPIMLRLVTRLAHSRAIVTAAPVSPLSPSGAAESEPDWRQWTLLPPNARRRYRRLLDLQATFLDYSRSCPYNRLELKGPRGIIACGIAHNYVREVIGEHSSYSLLKIACYPAPLPLIRELVDHCEEILVVEEGYPFIERLLHGLIGVPGKAIRGKKSGDFAPDGEMTADRVRAALDRKRPGAPPPFEKALAALPTVPQRPPRLCDGCPHSDTFKAIMAAVEGEKSPHLMSDIGCYTLGALPPYNAVHTCVDMGASISMGHGAAKAGLWPVVCTIGDSTFLHSGMTGLVGAAHEDADMTVVIMDNASIAMTGGQDAMIAGDELINLVKGLGVSPEHVVKIDPSPRHHQENTGIIRREIDHHGLSVVVACRPCIHTKRRTIRTANRTLEKCG
ncbi:MAG TPA: thiamine pyrophosphate-dependent enzyme [Phycisphaerae bacterium]|nr:thiamine pyrophosphate-dependent enzyme [Phycisphaerae bacterium]